MLNLVMEQVGSRKLPAAIFVREQRRIAFTAIGIIGNSVATSPTGKTVLASWKQCVAEAAKQARQGNALDSSGIYSISVGFAFHPPTHGNQRLDVENYIKPTLDGCAAGLFCGNAVGCQTLMRFNFDDSGFRHLFIQRLDDVATVEAEGALFVVSVQGEDPL